MPSRPRVSRRSATIPASPIRRLAPYAVAARERGITVHSLNIGQPDIDTPDEILDAFRGFSAPNVAYGPSEGVPELLDALHAYYTGLGLDVRREEIFVTTGGSEAILFVMQAIADPGDEVLVFEPFYTNYSGFAAMAGLTLRPVTTRAEDGYHLPDRSEIEKRIGERTRAVLICSPNNPTGTVYGPGEMELLASVCREHGLWLISDEVYREFVYDGLAHVSALGLDQMREQVVVVDSLSKRFSLCGARIGNVVCRNREVLDTILRCGQARLCPPTVEQLACAAFTKVPDGYLQRVLSEYRRRRDLVFDALSGFDGVVVRKPEGAFYLCTRLPVADAQDFAVFLLRDFEQNGETVMVAPGDGFYATPGLGRDEVRIAYVLEEGTLARAMEILGSALEAYPGRVPSPAKKVL